MSNRIRLSGTVASVSDTMAMVKPDPSARVSTNAMMIDGPAQFGSLPLERFLTKGMTVVGEYDPVAFRFHPDFSGWNEARFLDEYPDGTVVLGLVTDVTRQTAEVWVHPAIAVDMARGDVSTNAKDVIDHLWTRGDIVSVRVVRTPTGGLRLRATDVDDDEPVAVAPPVFVGGDPWLTVGQMTLIESTKEMWDRERQAADAFAKALDVLSERMQLDSEQLESMLGSFGTDTGEVPIVTEAPAAPAVTEVSARDKSLNEFSAKHIQRMIANYRVELNKLVEQNQQLSEALKAKTRRESDLAEQNDDIRAQLSTERQRAQALEKQLGSARDGEAMTDRRHHFATTEEWIAEEIRRFWIDTYAPADRIVYSLDRQPWAVLRSFADTFEALTDDGMDKAIKAATHIITGRNAVEHITEDHPLREGDENSRPEVTRADGAASRRAYIESHTPQSRRLHYWRLRDGSIELSRVGLHDDFTP